MDILSIGILIKLNGIEKDMYLFAINTQVVQQEFAPTVPLTVLQKLQKAKSHQTYKKQNRSTKSKSFYKKQTKNKISKIVLGILNSLTSFNLIRKEYR